nr:retrovirus-related Pol polyprotein from transposon TNT 1-94 [Tanacetum cinerariifolium]
MNYLLSAEDRYRGRGYDRGQEAEQKQVKTMDKVVNQAARDFDDAMVCCVENTVEDRIIDSGASFHATYCKEELERFKLHSGKVRLADDKTLDIAGVGDVVLKTSFGTNWTLKDVSGSDEMRYSFWDKKNHQVIRSRDITFVNSIYGARIHSEPRWDLDTSEGSENSRSFEDSGRSDEEYSEDRASCKEGGSKTPHVRRSTRESRAPIRGFLVSWKRRKPSVQVEEKSVQIKASTETMAKLVRILISEGSLSLLKILGTKSLAEMYTRLRVDVVQLEWGKQPTALEHVASCIVGGEAYCSTGFERRIVGCNLNPTSVE